MEDREFIKSVCKELGYTYKELAEIIGYGDGAIKTAISTNRVSQPMRRAIAMHQKILSLENELKEVRQLKAILQAWLKA